MREYRASVMVGSSVSYDHDLFPYLLSFVISFLFLTVGDRLALGRRGGSYIFVSMGIGCILVANSINCRLFKHSFQVCFSNFPLVVMWEILHPLAG